MKTIMKVASLFARILPAPMKRGIYKIKPLAQIIRKTLNAATPKGFFEIEIAAGILQGSYLLLDLQQEKDYWLGTYELDLQAAIEHYTQSGMCIYDVGANIGYISLMFAKLIGPSGKIFSFEALPENIKRFKRNKALNDFARNIKIIRAAVIDKSGTTQFLRHKSSAMGKAVGSAGRQEQYQESINVPAVSLDDFVFIENNPAPDLIKMDIEGGEALALQGMQKIFNNIRPILLIEIHGNIAGQIAWKLMQKNNYQVLRMGDTHIKITSLERIRPKDYLIALPNK